MFECRTKGPKDIRSHVFLTRVDIRSHQILTGWTKDASLQLYCNVTDQGFHKDSSCKSGRGGACRHGYSHGTDGGTPHEDSGPGESAVPLRTWLSTKAKGKTLLL